MSKSNKSTSEEYSLAICEETNSATLDRLWDKSKSVRVRKAVAQNPNASPLLLKKASRLYLEEVLTNPSFQLLELFDDDEWLRTVSQCYSDPSSVLTSSSSPFAHYYYYSNNRAQSLALDHFCWAILLSPNLNMSALDSVLNYISSTTLKRVLKNENTRKKIKSIYLENIFNVKLGDKNHTVGHYLTLSSLITIYRFGVIDKNKLVSGLSLYGIASESCSKSVYKKFVNELCKEYQANKTPLIPKILAKLFIISRRHIISWTKCSFGSITADTGDLLEWSGELCIDIAREVKELANSSSKKRDILENMSLIKDISSRYMKARFLENKGNTYNYSNSIDDAFRFLKSKNIDPSTAKSFLSFNFNFNFNFFMHMQYLLPQFKKASLEAREFFIKSGCLGSSYSLSISDNKTCILETTNNQLYMKFGVCNRLLYNCCSINKNITYC